MIASGNLIKIIANGNGKNHQFLLIDEKKDKVDYFIFDSDINYEESYHFVIYEEPIKIVLDVPNFDYFKNIIQTFMDKNQDKKNNKIYENINVYKIKKIFVFKNNKSNKIENNFYQFFLYTKKCIFPANCFTPEDIAYIQNTTSYEEYVKFVFNFIHDFNSFKENIELFNEKSNWSCNPYINSLLTNNQKFFYEYLSYLILLNPLFLFFNDNILIYEIFLNILKIKNNRFIFNAFILYCFYLFTHLEKIPIVNTNGDLIEHVNKKNDFYLLMPEFINLLLFVLNNRNRIVKKYEITKNEESLLHLITYHQHNNLFSIDEITNYMPTITKNHNSVLYCSFDYEIIKNLKTFLYALSNKKFTELPSLSSDSFLKLKNYLPDYLNTFLNLIYHNAIILNDNLFKVQENILNFFIENNFCSNVTYLIFNDSYSFIKKENVKCFKISENVTLPHILSNVILIFTETEKIDISFINYIITFYGNKIQKIIFTLDTGKTIKNFNEIYAVLPIINYSAKSSLINENINALNLIKNSMYQYNSKQKFYDSILDINEFPLFKKILIEDISFSKENILDVYIHFFYKVITDIFHYFYKITITNKEFLSATRKEIDLKNLLLNFTSQYKILTLFSEDTNDVYNLSSCKIFNKMMILYLLGIRFYQETLFMADNPEMKIDAYSVNPQKNIALILSEYKKNKNIDYLKTELLLNDFDDLLLIKNIPFIIKTDNLKHLNILQNDILTYNCKKNNFLSFSKNNQEIIVDAHFFNKINFDYAFSVQFDKLSQKQNNIMFLLLGYIPKNENAKITNYFQFFNLKKFYNLFDFFSNINKYNLVIYFGETFMKNFMELDFNYEDKYNLIPTVKLDERKE